MTTSESSDVVLSSDCSLSSEQSPVHQPELDQQPSTSSATVPVFTHVDTPFIYSEIGLIPDRSLDGDINNDTVPVTTGSCVCESETVVDDSQGSGSLLDEINDHLKQTHGRELLSASVRPQMSRSTADRNSEDMSLVDIDTALAEVMSGLELLGRSRGLSLDHGSMGTSPRHPAATASSSSSSPLGRVASPHTPDLVVGLPQLAVGAQSTTSPRPLELARSPPVTLTTSQLTSAEMFANVDRCTIKKSGPSTSAPSSAEIWTSSVHPLYVVDTPPPSAAPVGGRTASATEQAYWSSGRSHGGVATRGSPTRSQSCRAAERQSDQTWSTLWLTSSEMQRERDLGRTTVPARQLSLSPGREHAVSVDLPRFPSSVYAAVGTRKEPASLSQSFVATLPRDVAAGPKTPVKVKPPVMKKPVRSAEMMQRLSEYQNSPQTLTDAACAGLSK